MYMYEQRMKAEELFIESGFSENAVCRELGYPSGTELRRWILEIQPESIQTRKEICILVEKETCTPTGERIKWTWEQRRAVVEDMRINKTPMYHVAAECGVSKAAIYTWKRRLLGKDGPVPMKKPQDTPARPPADAPLEETVKTLELQVSELEERIFYLQLELDVINAAERLRKKERGINPTTLKWLTDITEFAIPAGKIYLSPVIDCYDGMPIAWTIGTHPNANLVNTMLEVDCNIPLNNQKNP